METVIGFIAGYLVGTSHGRAGLAKVRSSVEAIRTSPELRRLAADGAGIAGAVAKQAASRGVAGAVGDVAGRLMGRPASEQPRAA
ncbi:MAG TPA: hypothetical protein VLW44_19755 [Streptosporangiaceae bacterium]|nr:hypothetical protein [Streptosporangiaceae bacterium]